MDHMTEIVLWTGTATYLIAVGMCEAVMAPTRWERRCGGGAFIVGGLMWIAPLYAYTSIA